MQFAHNGSYKGSIPFGLTDVSSDPLAGAPKGSRCVKTYGLWRFSQRTGAILALEAPTTQCGGRLQWRLRRLPKGTWSSLVYGARLENEYFKKVVSSNLTVPV